MFWFKREKKRLYPAVYSEWLTEFKRMDTVFLTEQDAEMLKNGGLKDSKYSIDFYKRELASFLEKQLKLFFHDFTTALDLYFDENNSEYLLLLIRRYDLKYNRLFFYENYDFLPLAFRQEITRQMREKLRKFEEELIEYFEKLALYSASMGHIAQNIKRLIEV